MDKSSIKRPNTANFGEYVFDNLKFAVKQCYETGQFSLDKNWWKMPKWKNSVETFWAIFKHCGEVFMRRSHQRVQECILKMVENVYLYVFDDVLDVTYLMTLLAPHLVGNLGIPQAKLKINENQSRNVLYVFLTYPKKLLIQRGSQAKLSCYFFSIQ